MLYSNTQLKHTSDIETCHDSQANFTGDHVLYLLKRMVVLPKKQSKKGSGQHSKHSKLRAICGSQTVVKTNPQENFAPFWLFFQTNADIVTQKEYKNHHMKDLQTCNVPC